MELRLPKMGSNLIARCPMYRKSQQSKKLLLHIPVNDQAHSSTCKIICSASREKRGFGPRPTEKEKAENIKTPKEETGSVSRPRKSTSKQSNMITSQAPGLRNQSDEKSGNTVLDRQFEERLEVVRRSALEQRKGEETEQYGAIDYDTPVKSEQNTIGLGTKVGVGVAVVVFGLVFALGDFLPSVSVSPSEEATVVENMLTQEERATLQARLQQFEATLSVSPEDPTALEGAAVTLAELGEYSRAASLLENLAKGRRNNPEVYRLLGEVKYALKDYEGSGAAYRSSASVSETINLEVLRGLTDALLAAKKPNEAIQVLLASREHLSAEKSDVSAAQTDASGNPETEKQKVDPIQIDLLLGKAYSDWGHISDAVAVYDQLISAHPDDFRGYLAKGIILRENGKIGDAERMFIQARFFAPEKAKSLVDRYSRK